VQDNLGPGPDNLSQQADELPHTRGATASRRPCCRRTSPKHIAALQIVDNSNFHYVQDNFGLMPDLVSYNTLMSCFAREGHYRKVEALLQEMQQAHIEPDVYTCSTVVQAYGKANLLPKAVRAFEDMKAAGYRPNVIVYNSLLTTLSKALMPKYASEVSGGMC
jgi:pentatricopeptide repeat protein